MASLLSVMFVASSASGPRLLFAYPPNAEAIPRVQRPVYGKSAAIRDAQARSASESRQARSVHTASGDAGRREAAAAAAAALGDHSEGEDSSDEYGDSSDYRRDVFGSKFIRGESSSSSSDDDDDLDEETDEYRTRAQREKDSFNTYLGVNTAVLGHLLSPDRELSNKRFEMVLNHLAFIGHPYYPSKTSASTRLAHSRREAYARQYDNQNSPFLSDEDDDGNDSDGEADGVHVPRRFRTNGNVGPTSSLSSKPRRGSNQLAGFDSGLGKRDGDRGRSGPSSALSSRRTSQSVPAKPVGRTDRNSRDSSIGPASTSVPPQSESQTCDTHVSGSSRSRAPASRASSRGRNFANSHLAMTQSTLANDDTAVSHDMASSYMHSSLVSPPSSLNLDSWAVVLVVDSPPDQNLSYHLGVYYRDVVIPTMAALKLEQRKSGYVSREAAKIADLRDRAIDSGIALGKHIHDLREKSDLCEQLAQLYEGLKHEGLATLTPSDDIEMTVILHTELFEKSRQAYAGIVDPFASTYDHNTAFGNSAHALSLKRNQLHVPYGASNVLDVDRLSSQLRAGLLGRDSLRHPDVAPWQTLLPLQDVEDLLARLDDDDTLTRFLEIMNPTLTFAEYETLLDIDSYTITLIAEHLLYWRKARLIDAISLKSIYAPSRSGKATLIAEYSSEFSASFPELPPLPALLATLSNPQPFDSLLPMSSQPRSIYFDALTWLLQRELVVHMKVYMNLIASPEVKQAAHNKEVQRAQGRSSQAKRQSADAGSAPNEEDEDGDRDSETAAPSGKARSAKQVIGRSKNVTREGLGQQDQQSRRMLDGGSLPDASDSNFTISSASGSVSATTSTSRGSLANDLDDPDDISSAGRGTYDADLRSPLPRSFPQKYPYISAMSASSARPERSATHGKATAKSTDIHDRQQRGQGSHRGAYLGALTAPSIIANPSELTSEEELWIAEILTRVEAEKGLQSLSTFKRMLPYLDGTHHLDEVLFRAGISRKAIRLALADFDAYIVTFLA